MPASHRATRRSLSRRGKVVAGVASVGAVLVGTLGYFAFFPNTAPAFVRTTLQATGLPWFGPESGPPLPTCPLSGEEFPSGKVPRRPALAVKVENHPEARPQAGLESADIVYEEPVEGGITRFIAVYHCNDDARVGPVRSARTADPKVLSQFGVPVFAYSGGAPHVKRVVARSDLVALDETSGGDAFARDPNRVAPHNLYADTSSLLRVAAAQDVAPRAVFLYASEIEGRSRKVGRVHLPFSSTYADVYWQWKGRDRGWTRSHGSEPHLSEDGEPISATNVVVQLVDVVIGPRGGLTPYLELTGSGRAYVFRDGRMIVGRWERESLSDVTRFVAKDGEEIALAPGRTWVELFPSSIELELLRRGT